MGVYKSNLLNFLNRSTRQLLEQCRTALRHWQVAAVWSVEILLYPVYLLVQTGRLLPRRQPPVLPAVDRPITAVLAKAATITPEPIQAIATSLDSQALVLISLDQRIYDRLSLTQQKQLAQAISRELASYHHQRKLAQKPQRSILPAALGKNTILPARWFWQSMAWVQRGTVARNLDLFAESQLPANPLELIAIPPIKNLPLDHLDEQIAALETTKLVPLYQRLVHWSEQALPLVLNPQPQLPDWQALIAAAWAYFQGKPEARLAAPRLDHQIDQTDQTATLAVVMPPTTSPVIFESTPVANSPRSTDKSANKLANRLKKDPVVQVNAKPKPLLDLLDKLDPKEPDHIEAAVTPKGYVRHPLQVLIGWLDQAIAWIESLFSQIWQWLRHRHH